MLTRRQQQALFSPHFSPRLILTVGDPTSEQSGAIRVTCGGSSARRIGPNRPNLAVLVLEIAIRRTANAAAIDRACSEVLVRSYRYYPVGTGIGTPIANWRRL